MSGARIQELEDLLRQPLSPEQFYRGYLEILTRMNGLRGGHLWLLQGREFVPLGGSDRKDLLYDGDAEQKAYILDQIGRCAAREETVVVPAGSDKSGEGNRCPFQLAFTPMLVGRGGGSVQGAQVTWWIPGTINGSSEHPAVLDACSAYAARVMRSQKLESMAQISDQLQQMTLFLAELTGATDLESLGVTVVNRAREIVGCDRVALLFVETDGALRLGAISNVPSPNPRSAIGRTLLQLGDSARNGGLPALFRKASEKTEEKGDLSDYFYHSNMEEVMALAIQPPGRPLCGLLMFESARAGHFAAARQQSATALAAQASGMISTTLSAEQIPFRKQMLQLAAWRQLPPEEKKRRLRRRLWIPGAILLGLALFPVRFEVSGDARIMPRERAVAVAEVEGRIMKVPVKDGTPVSKGDILMQIDDAEQRKQLEIAVQEEARLQAEADRLMALNERAAAQVAMFQLERARRERKFREDNVTKTTVRSPISGIIMTPDLASRQGDAVQQGTQLALVGDPKAWDLEVGLPEADVALLLRRLHQGEEVPVRYLLNSLPHRKLEARVTGSDVVSSSSEVQAGRNLFRVTVPLPEDAEFATLFRAGYTGRARLAIGYRPIAYVTTRRFLNWIRTNVFF